MSYCTECRSNNMHTTTCSKYEIQKAVPRIPENPNSNKFHEEVKPKYEFTKQQLDNVERIAETRGFTIAIKAISIIAAQLLGPQHKVMILIDALKGN